jgi:threonine synthase
MKYVSTRGKSPKVGFCQAVANGLAPDGGLYLPEILPQISTSTLKSWEGLTYPELTSEFFSLFATDIEKDRLDAICARSYTKFEHKDIAPLVPLRNRLFVLELFHGPTLAFKDFALQLLGNLYQEQIEKTGKPITVLGATSGDTGAAAIHGLLGKEGVNIFILYPNGRVSPLQERQMTCTGASNVYPLAIEGSFDDAQKALKETFEDLDFKKEVGLSAVNSINLARILAQSVYYLYAYLQLKEAQRRNLTFVVPTGNFGNVFAGWLLRRMGVNIGDFQVATNQNDILYRFFEEGIYESGTVKPSLAPSMDIQVASNFERLLYYILDEDPEKVTEAMQSIKSEGRFDIPDNQIVSNFSASRTSDYEIPSIIDGVYSQFKYIVDPHTACGFKRTGTKGVNIILSTAHPAKFPDTIEKAIGVHAKSDSLEALKNKKIVKTSITATTESIQSYIRQKI